MFKLFKKNRTSFSDEEMSDIRDYRKKRRQSRFVRLRLWWQDSFFNAYMINRRMVKRYGCLVDLISSKLESQSLFNAFFNSGFKMDDKAVFSKEVRIDVGGLSDDQIMENLRSTMLDKIDAVLDAYGLLKYMVSSYTKIEEGMGYTNIIVFYKPSGYDSLYNGMMIYSERLNQFNRKLVIVLSIILGVFVVGMIWSYIYVRMCLLF